MHVMNVGIDGTFTRLGKREHRKVQTSFFLRPAQGAAKILEDGATGQGGFCGVQRTAVFVPF